MVDTHAHVFHRGLTFADTRRYAPAYDAPLDLYLQQLDQNGMTHGVLVQPSLLGTDNSYLVESIRTANGRLRGIAVVDPTISVNELSMLDKAGVVGIRLNLVGKRLPDLKTAEWTALLAGIRRLDWQVEVQRNAGDPCGPRSAPARQRRAGCARSLCAAGSKTRRIRSGICSPAQTRCVENPVDQDFRRLPKRAARRSLREAGLSNVASILRTEQRGSDWPHTQFESSQTYAKSRAFLDELIPDAAERAQILASPKALFRF
jgi:Amidohydrolase